jgi:glutamyl-tRNA(Gln) amidotransferase subunit E
MLILAEELKNRGLKPDNFVVETVDLTGLFERTVSPVLRGVLDLGGTIAGANLAGFHGILGFEPFEGIRLGSELADIARSYGYGGIFHSDELPAYGISETEVRDVKAKLAAADDDAFFLLAGVDQDLEAVTRYFQSRIKRAFQGSPAETRSPTEDGRTRFSRPRPGSARMYPETDISPIPISEEILARINESLPPSYSSQIETYVSKHQLSPKLAKQVFDSDRQGLFEDIVRTTHVQGSIVATTITETLVSLDRDAHDTSKILDSHLRRIFELLSEGIIAKEAIPEILTVIAEGKVDNADSAIQELSLSTLSITDLEQIIRTIVTEYRWRPGQKANDSFGPLMGEVMSKVRGRADGQKVSSLLRKAIDEVSTSASS